MVRFTHAVRAHLRVTATPERDVHLLHPVRVVLALLWIPWYAYMKARDNEPITFPIWRAFFTYRRPHWGDRKGWY